MLAEDYLADKCIVGPISYPAQERTGRRGYLANRLSLIASWQRRNCAPRSEAMLRACVHSPHRPGFVGEGGFFKDTVTCIRPAASTSTSTWSRLRLRPGPFSVAASLILLQPDSAAAWSCRSRVLPGRTPGVRPMCAALSFPGADPDELAYSIAESANSKLPGSCSSRMSNS